MVPTLSHVLDSDQVAEVPFIVKDLKHLGRFLHVLGHDVDATLRTFYIDSNVHNLCLVTGETTLQDFIFDHPGPNFLRETRIDQVTNLEARGKSSRWDWRTLSALADN